LHLDRGAVDEARRAFGILEQLVADQLPGPAGRLWTARLGSVLALELRDYAEAGRRAQSIDDPFWGPFTRAQVGSVTGVGDVAACLDAAVPRSPRHDLLVSMLRAAMTEDRDESLTVAERAVSIATTNGMLQTLASTGQLDLIERVAWRLPSAWMDRLRRTMVKAQSDAPTMTVLVEPLTQRERDVLRFLPSRLTLKEIADELYVSVNTLKFHLKVIYRKLGVNSRAEAAEIARTWGRIEHD
jgi:LuxR family maltose regulon positive regulatory protein